MIKKKTNRIKHALANALELPWEAMIGVARLVILNNTDIYLENHKGIKEYTLQSLRIQTENHELVVKGEKLELKHLGIDKIIIKGVIRSIEFS